MILVDAGPLVASIDRGEADHSKCVAALASITLPLVTTWPALTEPDDATLPAWIWETEGSVSR